MSVGILVDIGKSLTSFNNTVVSIDLDVTMDEAHEWQNDVTTNPVEIGSPIADHIQLMPDKLRITGMISDSSISDAVIKQFSGIDNSQFLTRVQTAFDVLRKLKDDRKLITVYTKFKVYTDMALTSLSIPRNNQTGDSIQFSIEFMHVRMVSTQTVDMPKGVNPKPKTKASKSLDTKTKATDKSGAKATKTVTTTQSKSVTDKSGAKATKTVTTTQSKSVLSGIAGL